MQMRLVESFGTCRTFLRISLEDKYISPYLATLAKEALARIIFYCLEMRYKNGRVEASMSYDL